MSKKEVIDIKELKKRLRSLLISVKGGITIRELENDYIEFFGNKLPYTDFGFSDTRTFLQSINDAVQIYQDEYGHEQITQVSDQSTQHIERLVAKQKSDPKRNKIRSKARFSQPPNYPMTARERNVPSPRPTSNSFGWARKGGDNFLGTGGRSDTISHDRKPTQSRRIEPLMKLNAERSNYSLPVRRPLMETPLKTPCDSLAPRFQKLYYSNNTGRSTSVNSVNKTRDCENVMPRSADTFQRGRFNSDSQQKENSWRWSNTKNETPRNASSQSLPKKQSGSHSYVADTTDSDENWEEKGDLSAWPGTAEQECIISKVVQDRVRQVLLKAPKGLWANKLPVMYKEMFSNVLPMREYGFHSVIEFVAAMPHLVRSERPYKRGDWMLFEATRPEEGAKAAFSDQQQQTQQAMHKARSKNKGHISLQEMDCLKESVRQVLQAHTDGVLLNQFRNIYEEMTGLVLDPSMYGEKDMDHLMDFLVDQGVLKMTDWESGESKLLFAVSGVGRRRFDFLLDCFKPLPYKAQAPEVKKMNFRLCRADDIATPGMIYQPADLTALKNNASCGVVVSYVVSLNVFWVQIHNNIPQLENLMDDLEDVYTKHGEDYYMPEDQMVHGRVCACIYAGDGNWHRGIITGNRGNFVQVYFVDYGNTSNVKRENVRHLKMEFLQLPVQAIQAKLAFIRPPVGQKTFSEESKKALMGYVDHRPLVAFLSKTESLVLSLVLVDTLGKKDFNINDELVDQGYCRFISEEEQSQEQARASDGASRGQTTAQQAVPGTQGPISHVYFEAGWRMVRLLEFSPDISFFTIFMKGALYVCSAQISCLVWQDDILAFMLQQDQFLPPMHQEVITRDKYTVVFMELERRGALFIDKETDILTVYPLSCIPQILDAFGDGSRQAQDLKIFIKGHLKAFDSLEGPQQSQQATEGGGGGESQEETGDEEEEGEGEELLTLEKLQLVLHSMQITRKRILRRMVSQSGCVTDDVAELEEAENSIATIENLIQVLTESQSTDSTQPWQGEAGSMPAVSQAAAPQLKVTASLTTNQQGSLTSNTVNLMMNPQLPAAGTDMGSSSDPLDPSPPQTLEELIADNQRRLMAMNCMMGAGPAVRGVGDGGDAGLDFSSLDFAGLQILGQQSSQPNQLLPMHNPVQSQFVLESLQQAGSGSPSLQSAGVPVSSSEHQWDWSAWQSSAIPPLPLVSAHNSQHLFNNAVHQLGLTDNKVQTVGSSSQTSQPSLPVVSGVHPHTVDFSPAIPDSVTIDHSMSRPSTGSHFMPWTGPVPMVSTSISVSRQQTASCQPQGGVMMGMQQQMAVYPRMVGGAVHPTEAFPPPVMSGPVLHQFFTFSPASTGSHSAPAPPASLYATPMHPIITTSSSVSAVSFEEGSLFGADSIRGLPDGGSASADDGQVAQEPGQLLPGMLPLLHSLKAYAGRPNTPPSLSLSTPVSE